MGQTPVLRREDKRRGFSCFCALTDSGKLYTIYFKGSIDGPRCVEALRCVRRYQKGPATLIWDGLKVHTSTIVKQYLATDPLLEVEVLPSYSPDVNPEEYCHGYVKERVRNATPADDDELLACVEREFNRIRRRPNLLRSFFQHAGVPVINRSG